MALLDVSEVLLTPEFMQTVKVIRKYGGYWDKGEYKQEEVEMYYDMLVLPVNAKEINMIPEADRMKDAKTFHCLKELYLTSDDKETRTSDVVEWKCKQYKLISVSDYSDYGYYKAFGVQMRGY